VVATPLGNLDDASARARSVLAHVDRIYAEDTRVTATLLSHFGIAARGSALHAHNEAQREREVIDALAAGMSVAIVSDAGTPAISDPGARIVRAAHEAGHTVVPVVGPSAAVAAVSAAGLVAEQFLFAGFLPRQPKARRAFLDRYGALPIALVVYEAPHRVRETVAELCEALGGDRTLLVAREITKRFEEIARMPLRDAAAWLAADANRVRGEFVLVVDAPPPDRALPELSADVERWLAALVAELPPAAAARIASAASGVAREVLYARASALRRRDR
jgi:16S rRNA (cytidine1402-2'-O)-methyltransferase